MHSYNRTNNVQLTFDDCGSPRQFRAIIEVLNRHRTRGTFYLTGECVRTHPSYVRSIKHHGHILQNHTYSHVDLCRLSDAQVLRQIRMGPRPSVPQKLVRPPYGACAFSPRIYRLAKSLGYRIAYWTVDTADWTGISARAMAHRVRHGVWSGPLWLQTPRIGPGGVILMHVHGRSTVEAVPLIIKAVKARGLSLQSLPPPPPAPVPSPPAPTPTPAPTATPPASPAAEPTPSAPPPP
jgi:peptidoglycan/xylan/chitin deacetylase (PgdA/CDA1 family)